MYHSAFVMDKALPPGWEVLYTPEKRAYYVNHTTQTTQWDHPNDLQAAKPITKPAAAIIYEKCEVCTYDNPPGLAACEMCGYKLKAGYATTTATALTTTAATATSTATALTSASAAAAPAVLFTCGGCQSIIVPPSGEADFSCGRCKALLHFDLNALTASSYPPSSSSSYPPSASSYPPSSASSHLPSSFPPSSSFVSERPSASLERPSLISERASGSASVLAEGEARFSDITPVCAPIPPFDYVPPPTPQDEKNLLAVDNEQPAGPGLPEPEPDWACAICTMLNKSTALVCAVCLSKPKPKSKNGEWACGICTYATNRPTATTCSVCLTPREAPQEEGASGVSPLPASAQLPQLPHSVVPRPPIMPKRVQASGQPESELSGRSATLDAPLSQPAIAAGPQPSLSATLPKPVTPSLAVAASPTPVRPPNFVFPPNARPPSVAGVPMGRPVIGPSALVQAGLQLKHPTAATTATATTAGVSGPAIKDDGKSDSKTKAAEAKAEPRPKRSTQSGSKVYGMPLEKVTSKHLVPGESKDSWFLPRSILGLADFLSRTHLQEEGLFRVSGQVEDVHKLMAAIDSHETKASTKSCFAKAPAADVYQQIAETASELSLGNFNAAAIAGAFKAFWQKLPEPLLTYALYKELLKASGSQEEVVKIIWREKKGLPVVNLAVVESLLDFLAVVSAHSEVNRMTTNNLAVVFAPSILRASPKETATDYVQAGQQIKQAISVVNHLINYRAELKARPPPSS